MNPIIEKIFERRGITPEMWESYNDPEHAELAHVDDFADALKEAHDANEKVTVLPDFDMDGIMSGVVGHAGLSALGFDVELFVPDPRDGYGFSRKQIDRLVKEHPGTQTIITCDTGIGCKDGVEYAKELGMRVIVTDHHLEVEASSPRGIADVVVDPCALDDDYEHSAICGAHVLWQCLDHYARVKGEDIDVERLWFLRVFAGIGTISDVMPVLYENRQLIKDAVDICRQVWMTSPRFLAAIKDAPPAYTQVFRGVYATMNMFAGAGKLKSPAQVDEEFFGFYMAPTFNSVKRMDGDLSRAFEVFLGQVPSENISYLLELNEERKRCVNEAMDAILAQDNPYAPYCYIYNALPGIMGLLAMKLSAKNGTPCVVVRENPTHTLSGSGRAPSWYPFITRTKEGGVKGHMAGHEGAFGCSFKDEEQLKGLYEFLDKDVDALIEELGEDAISPETEVDFTITASDGLEGDFVLDAAMLLDFVKEIDGYRPFGRDFEAPSALISLRSEDAVFVTMGATKDHLKIRIPVGENEWGRTEFFDILCWNQADLLGGEALDGTIKVTGTLALNDFGGKQRPQFSGGVAK